MHWNYRFNVEDDPEATYAKAHSTKHMQAWVYIVTVFTLMC